MENILLNPGSVVSISKVRVMITGYSFQSEDDKLVPCYVAVPYPLGYMNSESELLIPLGTDFAVIHSNQYSEGLEIVTERFMLFEELSQKCTESELMLHFARAIAAMTEETDNE